MKNGTMMDVCNLFKHLINEFRLQTYLTQPLDFRYLKEIAKIRMFISLI